MESILPAVASSSGAADDKNDGSAVRACVMTFDLHVNVLSLLGLFVGLSA